MRLFLIVILHLIILDVITCETISPRYLKSRRVNEEPIIDELADSELISVPPLLGSEPEDEGPHTVTVNLQHQSTESSIFIDDDGLGATPVAGATGTISILGQMSMLIGGLAFTFLGGICAGGVVTGSTATVCFDWSFIEWWEEPWRWE